MFSYNLCSFNNFLILCHTGITMTDGPLWEEQRPFALKHLRDLGFGKTLMEDLILAELKVHVILSLLSGLLLKICNFIYCL